MSKSKRKKKNLDPVIEAESVKPGLPRGLRLVLGNLAVLLVLLLMIFAGGEIYYRYIFDSTDSFGLTRVCQRWFQRHYTNNNIHVRDSINYSIRRVSDQRRITILGDSFTAGHGIKNVEDRFANLIRRNGAWEVHAVAANGLDTGRQLENFGGLVNGGYELDVLVLAYVLNDISDIVPEWQTIVSRIYSNQGKESFFVRHSYFVNVLYYRLRAGRDPDVANYYGFVKDAYTGRIWEQQKSRLQALNDYCRSKNARLLVVTFPFLHALDGDYEYQNVHDQLNGFWAELGVPHLDLLGVYSEHDASDLVVGQYDAHPNERAHAMAAAPITKFIGANL